MFKSEWLDWDGKLKEASRLKREEEERLLSGIREQQKQLCGVALELREAGMPEVEADGEYAIEDEEEAGMRAELERLDADAAALAEETQHLREHVSLAELELKENQQHEEHSKQYVRAVRIAEQELRGQVLESDQSLTEQRVQSLLRDMQAQRQSEEMEARRLSTENSSLRKKVDKEARQIKIMRQFLDRAERPAPP